jgi:hypothetical protein
LVVDTLGLVLAVVVHAADIQDRDGAKLVLAQLVGRFSRLKLIWADGGYAGQLIELMKCLLDGKSAVALQQKPAVAKVIWDKYLAMGATEAGSATFAQKVRLLWWSHFQLTAEQAADIKPRLVSWIAHARLDHIAQSPPDGHGLLPVAIAIGEAPAQVDHFEGRHTSRRQQQMIARQGRVVVDPIVIVERLEGLIQAFFRPWLPDPAIGQVNADHRRTGTDDQKD